MGFEFEDKDVKPLTQFTGLRNTVGAESFEPSDLAEALNVDITDALRIRRRKGYDQTQPGSFHSLWSDGDTCLVISNGVLYRYGEDDSLESLLTGLLDTPMSYCSMANKIYFANGTNTGAFDGSAREWGIRLPDRQPEAFAIGGTLRAGTYQYAVTFQRDDGSESGTGLAGVITLDSTGGIGFRNIPISTDSRVAHRNIYISPFDGDALYRLIQLGANETAATYTAERIGSLLLTTQHLSPPPPAHIVAVYNGIIYAARGNKLYYSKPYAPELFDLRANFPFNSDITLVAPVNDGIYLGTEDEIMFLAGNGPEAFSVMNLAIYGVIPGTLSYSAAKNITPDAGGLAAFFATDEGLCYGLNGGIFHNITDSKFVYPGADRGASIVRKHGGMVQFISSLQGTESSVNDAF